MSYSLTYLVKRSTFAKDVVGRCVLLEYGGKSDV